MSSLAIIKPLNSLNKINLVNWLDALVFGYEDYEYDIYENLLPSSFHHIRNNNSPLPKHIQKQMFMMPN